MGAVLLITLVFLLFGGLVILPYNRRAGAFGRGVMGLLVLMVLLLAIFGRV